MTPWPMARLVLGRRLSRPGHRRPTVRPLELTRYLSVATAQLQNGHVALQAPHLSWRHTGENHVKAIKEDVSCGLLDE